jgi:hypothetical protein
MNLIIAGSTGLHPAVYLIDNLILINNLNPSKVICGCADGVDRQGFFWARDHGVPVDYYPAWPPQWRWGKSVARPDEVIYQCHVTGRSAGYARNISMGSVGQALLLIWDGTSPGSRNMRDIALRFQLRVVVHKMAARR